MCALSNFPTDSQAKSFNCGRLSRLLKRWVGAKIVEMVGGTKIVEMVGGHKQLSSRKCKKGDWVKFPEN